MRKSRRGLKLKPACETKSGRISQRVPPDLEQALREEAERTGRLRAEIVRDYLTWAIAQRRKTEKALSA